MTTRDDWEERIRQAIVSRVAPAGAHTYVRDFFKSYRQVRYSKPVLYDCDDGRKYVVKGPHVARAIVAEQVVARLGLAMGAPVPPVRLIDVPSLLVKVGSGVQHGVSHGSQYLGPVYDDETFGTFATTRPENRARMASLAILYGWGCAGDHQWVFEIGRPNLVWSVDHGHFLPGGPNWRADDLLQSREVAPDRVITTNMRLKPEEIRQASLPLENITESHIAHAVAAPIDAWGITMEERVTLAMFLEDRRARLLAYCAA